MVVTSVRRADLHGMEVKSEVQPGEVRHTVRAVATFSTGMTDMSFIVGCSGVSGLRLLFSMHVGGQGQAVAQDGDSQPEYEQTSKHG